MFYIGDNHDYSEVADLDGDGDLDIVAGANLSGGGVAFFLNDGSGWFGGINRIIDGTYRAMFALADLDVDGDVDIAVRGEGEVIFFLNNSEASFEQAGTYTSSSRLILISAGDIDLDGVPDLVVPTNTEEELHLYFGKGDGIFETVIPVATGRVDQAAISDLLGDTHPEIVFRPWNTDKIQILQVICP